MTSDAVPHDGPLPQHATPGTQAANAWSVLWLLFLANLMNTYDRGIPAVIAEPLRLEYRLSDAQLGLVGTVFTLVYAVAGVPLGRLADVGSRRKVLGWGLGVWSAFTAFSGLASGFWSFLLIRLGVGVGEASYAPAANSLISDLFPPHKRSRAVGIYMLGIPLGLVLCFVTVGAIATAFGSWRAPFYLAAVPGLILAVLIFRIREPLRGAADPQGVRPAARVAHPIRTVLRIPTMWWIIVSGIGYNFAAYAVSTFMVPLLQRYFELSLTSAGLLTGALIGVTGLLGMTLGGTLADRVQQRHPRGRLLLCTAAMLAATVFTWLAFQVSALASFALLFGVGWFSAYLYAVCVYPTVQVLVVPELRATAMAVYFAAMYLLGAAFGSLAVGVLSDHYARHAQLAEGSALLTEAHKAAGLHGAMILVPVALLVTAVGCWMASKTYGADVARARTAV